jgi:tRNA G46 methylase TrmB
MFNKQNEARLKIGTNDPATSKTMKFTQSIVSADTSGRGNSCEFAAFEEHILKSKAGLLARLETGIDVADIGCGTGDVVNHLAKLYPNSRFTGFDVYADDILQAKRTALQMDLTNVEFHAGDVATLDPDVVFDLILPSTRYITGSYRSKFAWIDYCEEKTAVCR